MQTFKMVKQIHSGFSAASSNDVWIRKDVVCPISPFVGMNICDEEVSQVSVDSLGEVTLYTDEDVTFYDLSLDKGTLGSSYHKTEEFIQLIKEYIIEGWVVDRKGL